MNVTYGFSFSLLIRVRERKKIEIYVGKFDIFFLLLIYGAGIYLADVADEMA